MLLFLDILQEIKPFGGEGLGGGDAEEIKK